MIEPKWEYQHEKFGYSRRLSTFGNDFKGRENAAESGFSCKKDHSGQYIECQFCSLKSLNEKDDYWEYHIMREPDCMQVQSETNFRPRKSEMQSLENRENTFNCQRFSRYAAGFELGLL